MEWPRTGDGGMEAVLRVGGSVGQGINHMNEKRRQKVCFSPQTKLFRGPQGT